MNENNDEAQKSDGEEPHIRLKQEENTASNSNSFEVPKSDGEEPHIGSKQQDKHDEKELTFEVNNHVQNEKKGSAAERFFRRKPKNMLPNTMERELDWKTMLEERQKEETKLGNKERKKELGEVHCWR